MKKEFFKRAAIGSLLGVFISTVISIIVSMCVNDRTYYPVVPQLTKLCGSQTGAVAVQTAGNMLYGGIMAGISVIWDMDRWSLLRQTVTHFAACTLATLPAAYLLHWIEHSVSGVLVYFAFFAAVYLCIWLGTYFGMKRKVAQMNRRVSELDS